MHASVIVVGAGIGGLVAAVELAIEGVDVLILEQASHVGGKMDHVCLNGQPIDIGPTVMTMRHVFDALFARAGQRLEDFVTLCPLDILARHLWQDAPALDLYCHVGKNEAAIAQAFGSAAAQGYRDFCRYTEKLYELACAPFIDSPRPSWSAAWKIYGMGAIAAAWRIDARRTMAQALQEFFPQVPHLRQLFGRYATYTGSSPYLSPATLNLIAHVERMGVWSVEGGMHCLALGVAALARQLGVRIRFGKSVARILTRKGRACGVQLKDGTELPADGVVFNGDVRAVESGQFAICDAAQAPQGPSGVSEQHQAAPVATGLSAVTWALQATVTGRPLAMHNIVFAPDEGKSEFNALFGVQAAISLPTVYICAPSRRLARVTSGPTDSACTLQPEPLFCLINARPARTPSQVARTRMWAEGSALRLRARLAACGIDLMPVCEPHICTPTQFGQRYPGSDGALYGKPLHGWKSFFNRSISRGRVAGLFYAGGTVHPGPGVPMAARSGSFAARAMCQHLKI